MHHIEGAKCGLPVLYQRTASASSRRRASTGIGYRGDVADAIVETRSWYAELRRRVLALAPPVETMCVRYEEVLESLV